MSLRRHAAVCALALGAHTLVLGQAGSAAACDDPKELESFTNDWFLAKGCTYARDAASNAAEDALKGGLTNLAKNLMASTMDSYVPGLSSLMGMGGEDPFAAHVERILDAIQASEERTARRIDALFAGIKDMKQVELKAKYDHIQSMLREWTLFPPARKLDQVSWLHDTLLYDLGDLQFKVGGFAKEALYQSDEVAPYPMLGGLDMYLLLAELRMKVSSEYIVYSSYRDRWVAAGRPETAQEILDELGESSLDPGSYGWLVNEEERLIEEVFTFADELAQENPYQNIVNWMFAETNLVAGTFEDFDATPGDLKGVMRSHYTIRVEGEQEEQERFLIAFATPGQPVCAALVTEHNVWFKDGVWYVPEPEEYELPICTSTFPVGRPIEESWSLLKSVIDRAFAAHKNRLQVDLMANGYAPLRTALDGWWDKLVKRGRRSGSRPYLTALDGKLDGLLWNDDLGRPVGEEVDAFLATTSGGQSLSARDRSRFVGFAFEQGTDGLLGLSQAAWLNDRLYPQAVGYPIQDHRRLIREGVGSDAEAIAFYKGLFASKFTALR